ncbi:MAG: KH domain-containing protein [Eubacteriales bacterium]|jgi:predicted RNA-binding protein YlqC (UPF0109 family)
MTDLILALARALVDNPDAVQVTEREEDDAVVYMLDVAQEDKGKIIGKQGKIASAIRTVVKAAANSDEKKVVVKIV